MPIDVETADAATTEACNRFVVESETAALLFPQVGADIYMPQGAIGNPIGIMQKRLDSRSNPEAGRSGESACKDASLRPTKQARTAIVDGHGSSRSCIALAGQIPTKRLPSGFGRCSFELQKLGGSSAQYGILRRRCAMKGWEPTPTMVAVQSFVPAEISGPK